MNVSKNLYSKMVKQCVPKLQLALDNLLKKEPKTMEDAVEWLGKRRFHGVYVISIHQNSKIIYIGRSIWGKGKLWQRLSNHFGKASLDTFGLRGKAGRKKAKKYFVRFIGIGRQKDNHKGRRDLEFFAISVLSPEFNKG
jgi:hypothetical protein